MPWQIMVGPKGLAEGKVELKHRSRRLARESSSPAKPSRKLIAMTSVAVTRIDALSTVCGGERGHCGHNWRRNRGKIGTMDETMNEPVRPAPFAPFEWMLSRRYLRARRKEGFISVIAGFSFLGIMLGVATLIIVMAVMNGFRNELLDKILGLNGHLLVQPLGIAADRLEGGRRAHQPGAGRPARRAGGRRPGAGVLAVQCLRRAGARHARRRSRQPHRRSPRTSSRARSTASTKGRASRSAAVSPISCRCMPATASRWWRRAAR